MIMRPNILLGGGGNKLEGKLTANILVLMDMPSMQDSCSI